MKKFNQLTEKQMSKTNGGFLIITGIVASVLAVGSSVGIGAALSNRNKDK